MEEIAPEYDVVVLGTGTAQPQPTLDDQADLPRSKV